jgi:hypothetical protein
MVLSSLSPLFVLWAIRGNSLLPDAYFVPACALMAFGPTAALAIRVRTAIRQEDRREVSVGKVEDHRAHLLTYLFAVLLPFYGAEVGSWRGLLAMLGALVLLVYLFWRLNLHYLNVAFAMLGYNVFTVFPKEGNELTDRSNFVVISKRPWLPAGTLAVYRLSDTVYFER